MGDVSAQPDKQQAKVPATKSQASKAVTTPPLTEAEERKMLREMIERRKAVYDALAK